MLKNRTNSAICDTLDNNLLESQENKKQKTNCIAISIETTGLNPFLNEVTRISIYGNYGKTIYNRTFGVEHPEQWDKYAKEISLITPESVKGLMTFKSAIQEDTQLLSIFEKATLIVGHNMQFILGFLGRAGVNLNNKNFGDTNKCFVSYAYKHKLYNASGKLTTATKTFKLQEPRVGHTEDKAKAAYEVWLVLVDRRSQKIKTLDEMRTDYIKRTKISRVKKNK